jgi:hypothetical protein
MKHLKSFNESNEFTLEQRLESHYGKEVIEEYTQLMADIKDRCYDLIDLGFDVKIDWAYSTKERLTDRTPKIEILIFGQDSLFDENYDDIVLPCIDSIRALIRELGFSSGGGFTSSSFAGPISASEFLIRYETYKIVAQK